MEGFILGLIVAYIVFCVAKGVRNRKPETKLSLEVEALAKELQASGLSVQDRGLLTVKAGCYLKLIENGSTPTEANLMTYGLNETMPTRYILDAKRLMKSRYGNKQLPMIADAMAKGFGH